MVVDAEGALAVDVAAVVFLARTFKASAKMLLFLLLLLLTGCNFIVEEARDTVVVCGLVRSFLAEFLLSNEVFTTLTY